MKIKLSQLEGLRGVMAFVIFICHLRNFIWLQELDRVYLFLDATYIGFFFKTIIQFLLQGGYPVWTFWLLSAYVIMIKLFNTELKAKANTIWLQSISKRYFRLLIPSLFSILIAYFLLNNNFMFNDILGDNISDGKTKKWLENLYSFEPSLLLALKDAFVDTFFNFNFNTSYNNVLWSIENEFLGSIFIFILFIFLRKNKYRFIVYLLGIIFIVSIKKYWLLSFLLGYILCDIDFSNDINVIKNRIKNVECWVLKFKKPIFGVIIIFLIFQNVFLKKMAINFSSQDLVSSVLIFYAVLRFNFLKIFFSKQLFLFLGKISFSLYLVHIPVLSSLSSYLLLQNHSGLGKIIISIITIIVSILTAHLFTILIDQKSVILSNKIGKSVAGFFYKPQNIKS